MLQDTALLVAAILLVVLNGFFVAAEFAIVKLRGTRVAELERQHGWRGRILARIHARLDAYLSACQLGITLASLGLGWIGEPAFARLIEKPAAWLGLDEEPQTVEVAAFVLAFSVISFLHIVVGELAPKSLALRKPEAISLWTAIPLWAFYWLMYPFIQGLNASANAVLRLGGLEALQDGHAHEAPYSREELRSILHLSRPAAGAPERAIATMLSHALELPDLAVSDLQHPLREMVSLPRDASFDDVRRIVRRHGYSRYPVQGEGREVLGVLHIKDLLLEERGPDYRDRLARCLHPALVVREDAPVETLLRTFQHGASHFALVMDREGVVGGFLTLEDVLEAVFGEITDEHERRRRAEDPRTPRPTDDGGVIARGDTALFRIERALDRAIEGSQTIGTVSGLLMQRLDRVPRAGDVVDHDGLRLEVLDVNGPRVGDVRIAPHAAETIETSADG